MTLIDHRYRGYDALIQPTNPDHRIPHDKIKVERLQTEDLNEWVKSHQKPQNMSTNVEAGSCLL